MVHRKLAATGRIVVGHTCEPGLVRDAWMSRHLVRAEERELITADEGEAPAAR